MDILFSPHDDFENSEFLLQIANLDQGEVIYATICFYTLVTSILGVGRDRAGRSVRKCIQVPKTVER